MNMQAKTLPRAKVETKSAADVSGAFDEFHRAFAAFKETNDERLDQIETRMSSDVITEEKLTRIDRALDDNKRRVDTLLVERARPSLARSEKAADDENREHKAAFNAYVRTGEAQGLKGLEGKALSWFRLS